MSSSCRPGRLVVLPLVLLPALATAMSDGQSTVPQGPDRTEPIAPVPNLPPQRDARASLGRDLFNSKLLSRDGERSCASCHDLTTNGAESRKVSLSASGKPLQHNALTVFNAVHNFRQHWAGEARTLQDQIVLSVENEGFMNESWDDVIKKVARDPALAAEFNEIYARPVDRAAILDALAAFEATLVTPDSSFDRWLRGDKTALKPQEEEGYRLFKSAGCISCHQGVNIGGNLFAKAGVFQPLLKGPVRRMRVPSLRNVAVTAPYFDDGSAATLDEAVRRMAEAQLGRQLTPPQIDSIVAFLKTLTGRYEGHPLRQAQ